MIERPAQGQLQVLCVEWQKRLRLCDWHIQAKFIDRHMFPDSRAAHVTIEAEHKTAIIEIGWPDQFATADPWVTQLNTDWEKHLVHELLHLHLDAWDPSEDSLEHVAQEVAVNLISGALVDLARYGGAAEVAQAEVIESAEAA